MMSVGSKPAGLGQQLVGALADRDLALDRVGLAGLVERHDDDAGAVALDDLRLVEEVRLAFLQADRVDDALALDALEAGFDDRPARAVDHHRHAGDLRLGRDVVQERRHRLLGVEHAFVHVDVDDVRAAADLLGRDLHGLGVVLGFDQAGEPRRAGDVRPLADHLEVAVGADGQRLETGELRVRAGARRTASLRRRLRAASSATAEHRRDARRDALDRLARSRRCDPAWCRSSRRRCWRSRWSTKSSSSWLVSAGCSSYSPNAFGRPAFG